tara:strand:+ start:7928 stop:9733 length:1806 start_codon:yes stop_codon:yes gene_type:complete
MVKYFFIFFLFLSSLMFVGRSVLLYYKKFNININFLSLNLVVGLFIVGSFSFIYNFFSGISGILFTYLLIGILFISLFFVILVEKNFKIILKYLTLLFIFSFLFLFYSNQLPPGYDSGLYHIPHQVIIQNEKIVIGLVNMHSRFGLSTFYNYIAAFLWKENNFTIVSFLQSTYLIVFFIFLYELIEKKIKIFNIIVLTSILTMPIWFRYNIPGFSLVDLPYGIFFYLSVILSFLILIEKTTLKNTYILYFVFCCSLAFMHKSNGAQLLPLFIFTLGFAVYSPNSSFSNIFKILLIPSVITLLWILRTTIISGCLVYPVEITCYNFSWISQDGARETFVAIQGWAFRGFDLINFKPYFIYVILILVSIFFLFVLIKKKITFKFIFNNKVFLVFYCTSLIYLFWQAKPLQGFSSLITDSKNIEAAYIFKKEIILLILSNLFAILFSIYINNFSNNFSINLKQNYFSKIPFFFILLYFAIWLITAPNPRFAFGAFALISPLFVTFFFPNFTLASPKNLSNFVKLILIIAILKFTLLDSILSNKFKFELKSIPEIKTINRNGFGSIPKNFINDNRCWKARDCYFSKKDILVLETFYNYKIYKKIK